MTLLDKIWVKNDSTLVAGDKEYRCAIGKRGFARDKEEGDLKTPVGTFALRDLYYRPDRVEMPEVPMSAKRITPVMGWCDAAHREEYNTRIRIPVDYSHEELWRKDNRYDVFLPIGYNDDPPVMNKGSAIFFHIAEADYEGTAGCVAISLSDMLALLPQIGPDTFMHIAPE